LILPNNFNCNKPTTVSLIKQFEVQSGILLPKDYADFLCRTDGGEGFVGSAYLILWRLEDLSKLNQSYQVSEYAPGLLLFGSDGGGEAFAFDTRQKTKRIVSVPFVGMSINNARIVADTFTAFLEYLSKLAD
jgi:hypothetical protein